MTLSYRHSLGAVFAALLLHGQPAGAQGASNPLERPAGKESEVEQTEPVRAADELEKVVVKASSSRDERRESNASRIIVSGDDLTRYGDSNVADVLKRLPGITVNGARGGEIRMRGLGSGYTLILLNGEPTAPDFSIDSISPDLIDRIEISRSAMADKSTQAIAGSINIILKQVVRQAQRDFKAYVSSEGGQPTASLGGQWADRAGATSYSVGTEFRRERYRQASTIVRQTRDPQGQLTEESVTNSLTTPSFSSFSLTPRINLALDAQDALSAEGFLFQQQQDSAWPEQVDTTVGPLPLITATDAGSTRRSTYARGRLGWVRKLEDAAQLEVKLGASQGDRRQHTNYDSLDEDGAVQRHRTVDSWAKDQSFTFNGKYRAPFMEAHTVSLGWDGEQTRRTESMLQSDAIPHGLITPDNEDEAFKAQVNRLALFVQDEWELSPSWSVYQGLRWESLDTRTSGQDFAAVSSQSSVFSPVLQSLWKVPDTKGDQVRLAVSRTYKAPGTRDLSPRRYIGANENTATSPDYAGNPALRPELAWGLDMAYERYLGNGGLLSASAYARHIDDVIARQVSFDPSLGAWVSRPVNAGRARTYGIELEAKANARQWIRTAPAVDLRVNLARNWSAVESVPGPHNSLAQQTPLSANVGADWRVGDAPLTVGGNFGFMGAGPVAISSNQTASSSIKRQLDAYGAWKLDSKMQLRLSLSNLLHQDQLDDSLYANADGSVRQFTTTPTDTVIRLALEVKLAP